MNARERAVGGALAEAIVARAIRVGVDAEDVARPRVEHGPAGVAVADVGEATIDEVAEAIRKMGRRSITVTADLTEATGAQAMLSAATRTFPQIDILICNAGGDIASDGKSKANPNDMFIPEVDLHAVFNRNLATTMNTCRAVVPNMLEHKRGGRIVNLASIAGMTGIAKEITYGVAKAGVIQYTRCLAAQLRPHGITVNAVAPGMIKSGRFLATLKHREGAAELLGEKRPLLRLGEPDDVARVVEFFVTNLSEYVTGQVLRVDGGMQLYAG